MPRQRLSFNTQPPEGGWKVIDWFKAAKPVSTHSRPKAAGSAIIAADDTRNVSTHSRPKAAGQTVFKSQMRLSMFQHTAARRRLGQTPYPLAEA